MPTQHHDCTSVVRQGFTRTGGGLCGQLQSSHRVLPEIVKAVGGWLLAVENAVGPDVGVWECLQGRVKAGVLKGKGFIPPPTLQAIPWWSSY